MSLLLKAAPIVEKELEVLKGKCTQLKKINIHPTLKIILAGNDNASVVYTNNKKKYSEKIGINCQIISLPENISVEDFSKIVKDINNDPKVDGQLIQLPLPSHLNVLDVENLVIPEKDVDGLHQENLAKLFNGKTGSSEMIPCTPKGIISLLKYYNINISGKNVAIIGRGPTVGKPLSLLFTNHNATVTLCHSKTKDIRSITKKSDIIVSAIGKSKYLDKSYLSENGDQVIIDVGINTDENGKLCGDVDFENVKNFVSAITPVPGGVGPLTILSLAQNLIFAAENRQRNK